VGGRGYTVRFAAASQQSYTTGEIGVLPEPERGYDMKKEHHCGFSSSD